jgi:hypothetical protein
MFYFISSTNLGAIMFNKWKVSFLGKNYFIVENLTYPNLEHFCIGFLSL